MVTGSWCLGGLFPIITGNHLKITSQLYIQQAISLSSMQVQGGIIHNRTSESYSQMLTTATHPLLLLRRSDPWSDAVSADQM